MTNGALGFTPNGGARIDLNSSSIKLLDLSGTGAVDPQIQAVVTPARDGETFVRVLLPPRFLIANLRLLGSSYAVTQALRRTLQAALNPKLGIGVLDWTPIDGGTTYEIDAIVAGGLAFPDMVASNRFYIEAAPISFRCPDPAWRESVANAIVLGAAGGGLGVPVDIPWDLASAGATQVINNTGDLDTYPVITTSGTFTSLKVTNETTGKLIWFNGLTVTSPAVLTIDMDARTADVDGTNVMPYRTADSEAWPLVPGNNTITVTVSAGSVDVTVTYDTLLIGI